MIATVPSVAVDNRSIRDAALSNAFSGMAMVAGAKVSRLTSLPTAFFVVAFIVVVLTVLVVDRMVFGSFSASKAARQQMKWLAVPSVICAVVAWFALPSWSTGEKLAVAFGAGAVITSLLNWNRGAADAR